MSTVERPSQREVDLAQAELIRQQQQSPPPIPATPDHNEKVIPATGERPRTGRETAIVFIAFWIAFALIGYRIVIDQHVVVFDAVDRVARAYLVWHNDPPKLAAIGFAVPPFTALAYIPFTIVKPLATSLIALPVASGMFAAGTIAVLNRMMSSLELSAFLRLPLLIAFAANPMFLFYATNGMSEAFYLFLMAAGLYAFIEWYLSEQPRFLIMAGIAFSLALLTRYQFFIWAAFMAFMIAAALQRRKAGPDEIEGSVIAFLCPVIYAAALWLLFNLLILGDPIGWLTDQQDSLAVNSAGGSGTGGADIGDVAANLFEISFGLWPLAAVVLVVLVLAFVIQRNDMALWLAVFVLVGIFTLGIHATIEGDLGVLELRDTMPLSVVALVGATWLMFSLGKARIVVWGVTLLTLLVSIFTAWVTMKDYRFQNQEQAFIRAIETGNDQEGTSSVGGYNVGIEPERRMAAFIKRNVRTTDTILTDNAQTFGVILLSGRPQIFNDRIDRGDSRWRETVQNPWGRVDYILLASDSSGDLIRRRYPTAVTTGVPGFSQAFKTDRYLLLRIAASNPRRVPAARRTGPTGQSGPQGATPFGSGSGSLSGGAQDSGSSGTTGSSPPASSSGPDTSRAPGAAPSATATTGGTP